MNNVQQPVAREGVHFFGIEMYPNTKRLLVDTITAIAISVFAIIGSAAFITTAPAFSAVLLTVPIFSVLFWIYRRFGAPHAPQQTPIVINQPARQPTIILQQPPVRHVAFQEPLVQYAPAQARPPVINIQQPVVPIHAPRQSPVIRPQPSRQVPPHILNPVDVVRPNDVPILAPAQPGTAFFPVQQAVNPPARGPLSGIGGELTAALGRRTSPQQIQQPVNPPANNSRLGSVPLTRVNVDGGQPNRLNAAPVNRGGTTILPAAQPPVRTGANTMQTFSFTGGQLPPGVTRQGNGLVIDGTVTF